jgi:hypothetical protein
MLADGTMMWWQFSIYSPSHESMAVLINSWTNSCGHLILLYPHAFFDKYFPDLARHFRRDCCFTSRDYIAGGIEDAVGGSHTRRFACCAGFNDDRVARGPKYEPPEQARGDDEQYNDRQ